MSKAVQNWGGAKRNEHIEAVRSALKEIDQLELRLFETMSKAIKTEERSGGSNNASGGCSEERRSGGQESRALDVADEGMVRRIVGMSESQVRSNEVFAVKGGCSVSWSSQYLNWKNYQLYFE